MGPRRIGACRSVGRFTALPWELYHGTASALRALVGSSPLPLVNNRRGRRIMGTVPSHPMEIERRGPLFDRSECRPFRACPDPPAPTEADASLLSPEAEDTLAKYIALFVIFVVPVVLIVLFWMVHILPEKIAHKRHHPQFEAIRTLCLLSLVFGGLLWPLAWIWAYSKPVMHKLAYGTDKHVPMTRRIPGASRMPPRPVEGLHERLARLEATGLLGCRAEDAPCRSRRARSQARGRATSNGSPPARHLRRSSSG